MTTPRYSSRPRESESRRLQRDIDSLTKTMSLQQRRTASLDESLRHVSEAVSEKRQLLQTVVPSSKDLQRLQQKAAVLENQLMKEKVSLNRENKENQRLRDRINEYRLDKVQALERFQAMEKEAEELNSTAEELNERLRNSALELTDRKLELVVLKERGDSVFKERETRVKELFLESETERKRTRDSLKTLGTISFPDNTVFVDNKTILETLYGKWTEMAREQKKAVDQYNRTVRFLKDSFEEIKSATGVPSVPDMVTTFIKSYEQEQLITESLSRLSSEADVLRNRLAVLEERHKALLFAHREKMSLQQTHLEQLKRELEELREMFIEKVTRQGRLEMEMESVREPVQRLLSSFQMCNLPPTHRFVSLPEPDTNLNHQVQVLEDGIEYLLKYLSMSQRVGLPALYQSELALKTFGEAVKVSSTQVKGYEEKNIDEVEVPISEEELRKTVARRIPLPR